MRKHFAQTAVILAAVSAIGLTACTQGSASAPIPDTIKVENVKDNVITVQSTEEVKVVPDMAELVFSVTTQAADAKACQEQNSKDLDHVISFLKGTGIAETSIQTSNYGLDPIYDWNSGRTITGYEMNTTITVSDIPIDQAGTLISLKPELTASARSPTFPASMTRRTSRRLRMPSPLPKSRQKPLRKLAAAHWGRSSMWKNITTTRSPATPPIRTQPLRIWPQARHL